MKLNENYCLNNLLIMVFGVLVVCMLIVACFFLSMVAGAVWPEIQKSLFVGLMLLVFAGPFILIIAVNVIDLIGECVYIPIKNWLSNFCKMSHT